jgi:general secretion pathway protein B
MSYILDALRKSDHERQMAAGQTVGMLYPVEIKRNNRPWLIPVLLGLGCLIAMALIWQKWVQQTVSGTSNAYVKPVAIVPPQTKTVVEENKIVIEEKLPVILSGKAKPIPESVPQKPRSLPDKVVRQKQPDQSVTTSVATPNATLETNKTEAPDSLKDLPAMNITGYVHNEQTGSMAMINNQLVHEGEEVSPGLRLVKILDNSAIFSYKGYVFTR